MQSMTLKEVFISESFKFATDLRKLSSRKNFRTYSTYVLNLTISTQK